jgi:two-component system chemotaxis sensor kinase CheA
MSTDYKIFDTLLDAVIVVDSEWGVHYGNDAAGTLCGLSARRFKGAKPLSHFIQFSEELLKPGAGELSTQYRELPFQTSSGASGWIQFSMQVDPQASGYYLVYLRDVSLEKSLHDKYRAELDQKEQVIKDLKTARVQLEEYSKNLEKMVGERTAELREANRILAAILDSLGQGILVFDKNGKCLPFHSKVSNQLLETDNWTQPIEEILKVPQTERELFESWKAGLFSDLLPFEDMIGLGPTRFRHSMNREISLHYNSMCDEAGHLQGVVVVATDKTEEVQARREAIREKLFARRILQIVSHREQFRSFAKDAVDILTALTQSSTNISAEEVARHLHTLKGGASSFALSEIAQLAHEAESEIDRLQFGPKVEKLKAEFLLFLEQNRALYGGKLDSAGRIVEVPAQSLYSRIEAGLCDVWMEEYLKVSIKKILEAYDGTLTDLAEKLEKKMKPLKFIGEDVQIFPEPYENLFQSFVHLFRNAVDHGLEKPQERIKEGKEESGEIQISFHLMKRNQKRFIQIKVQDDGAGLNMGALKQKIASVKTLAHWQQKSPEELYQVIFEPSFSTSEQVTEISGRGVGLAALKDSALALGGSVRVVSTPGQGCQFIVEVPDFSLTEVLVERASQTLKAA